jgi:molybdopterin biosynthesis enzyme
MRAEIIAVGSELLSQARLETNSVFITQKLNESGLRVMRKFVVEDREEEIRGALESAIEVSEVVILTGGAWAPPMMTSPGRLFPRCWNGNWHWTPRFLKD